MPIKTKFLIIFLVSLFLSVLDTHAQYQQLSIAPRTPAQGDADINGHVSAYFYKDFENYRNSYAIEFQLKRNGEIEYKKLVDWNPYRQEYNEVSKVVYGSYNIDGGYITIRWENGITDKGAVNAISDGRIRIRFNSSSKLLKGTYTETR